MIDLTVVQYPNQHCANANVKQSLLIDATSSTSSSLSMFQSPSSSSSSSSSLPSSVSSSSSSSSSSSKPSWSPEGYLSSHVADETSQGSRLCPWQLVVSKGQRINLTLYDFGGGEGAGAGGTGVGACLLYGVIKPPSYVFNKVIVSKTNIFTLVTHQ
ncbi:hypothetical protein HELRODRAFT_175036 [Helobdella robusta]|uniref:CUB domain-containing protein n=1 Tax=Helobdella robusta TaxID=6412 RepID=T1F8R7_HELRO|nr:hypothetical protein HELRODRAFT_175036 [Helobdella robusta]ESO01012.1 hypothetical protein HELRODRAFT_175036 [Helobdella robusta]